MAGTAGLPSRYRGLLRGFDYFRTGRGDLAEREFRNLLAVDPDDPEAWQLLGETLFNHGIVRGFPEDGYAEFKKAHELDPDLATALWHLRLGALWQGRIDEFDSLTARYVERFGDADGLFIPGRVAMADARLATFLQAEDDAARERWFADLERASDDEASMAAGVLVENSWPDHLEGAARAARILTQPARSPSARAAGYSNLGELAMREGRWGDANRHARALVEVDPVDAVLRPSQWAATSLLLPLPPSELSEIRADVAALIEGSPTDPTLHLPWGTSAPPAEISLAALLRLSVLSARLGDFAMAREYARRLAALPMPEVRGTLPNDFQRILRAHIRYHQGDPRGTLAALDSARFEAPGTLPAVALIYWAMLLRAEAHYELGELERARSWFGLWPRRLHSLSHLRDLGPALYRLGQIHEAMGEPDSALARYEQFVDLWKNADSMLLPRVEEARGRIAALRSQ